MNISWNTNTRTCFDNFQLQYYSNDLRENFRIPKTLNSVVNEQTLKGRKLTGGKETCLGMLTLAGIASRIYQGTNKVWACIKTQFISLFTDVSSGKIEYNGKTINISSLLNSPALNKLLKNQKNSKDYPVTCFGPIEPNLAEELYKAGIVLGYYKSLKDCKNFCNSGIITINNITVGARVVKNLSLSEDILPTNISFNLPLIPTGRNQNTDATLAVTTRIRNIIREAIETGNTDRVQSILEASNNTPKLVQQFLAVLKLINAQKSNVTIRFNNIDISNTSRSSNNVEGSLDLNIIETPETESNNQGNNIGFDSSTNRNVTNNLRLPNSFDDVSAVQADLTTILYNTFGPEYQSLNFRRSDNNEIILSGNINQLFQTVVALFNNANIGNDFNSNNRLKILTGFLTLLLTQIKKLQSNQNIGVLNISNLLTLPNSDIILSPLLGIYNILSRETLTLEQFKQLLNSNSNPNQINILNNILINTSRRFLNGFDFATLFFSIIFQHITNNPPNIFSIEREGGLDATNVRNYNVDISSSFQSESNQWACILNKDFDKYKEFIKKNEDFLTKPKKGFNNLNRAKTNNYSSTCLHIKNIKALYSNSLNYNGNLYNNLAECLPNCKNLVITDGENVINISINTIIDRMLSGNRTFHVGNIFQDVYMYIDELVRNFRDNNRIESLPGITENLLSLIGKDNLKKLLELFKEFPSQIRRNTSDRSIIVRSVIIAWWFKKYRGSVYQFPTQTGKGAWSILSSNKSEL